MHFKLCMLFFLTQNSVFEENRKTEIVQVYRVTKSFTSMACNLYFEDTMYKNLFFFRVLNEARQVFLYKKDSYEIKMSIACLKRNAYRIYLPNCIAKCLIELSNVCLMDTCRFIWMSFCLIYTI